MRFSCFSWSTQMNNTVPLTIELAPRWRRLAATLIDACLVPSLTVVLVMLTDVAENAEDYVDNAWIFNVLLLAILSYLALNGLTLWQRGQTVGKLLLGIMIIPHPLPDQPQSALTPAPLWRLIAIRAWFFPVTFLLILPWVAWLPLIDLAFILGKQRRCLHDRLSGTLVVKRPQ